MPCAAGKASHHILRKKDAELQLFAPLEFVLQDMNDIYAALISMTWIRWSGGSFLSTLIVPASKCP